MPSKLAYLTLCRSIRLLVLLARGDTAKDLEIMVCASSSPSFAARSRGPGSSQVLRTYVDHYNQHRPHRTLGLVSPDPPARLTILGEDDCGSVQRRDLLGGLLHEYRQAA